MPETHEKEPPRRWRREVPPVLGSGPDLLPGYAELHCISNFSFQRGASHPQELVQRAYNLGYQGMAITDECSVAGVVRAHMGLQEYLAFVDELETVAKHEPRKRDFHLLFGSEFDLGELRLVAIARDLESWGGLCEFITAARMSAEKGDYRVGWEVSDFTLLRECEIVMAPKRAAFDPQSLNDRLAWARALWGSHLWLAVELPNLQDDALWLSQMRACESATGVPLVAAGDVCMHRRSRKPLHDVITAVQMGRPVQDCGYALQGNAERHLRQRKRLAGTYPTDLLANTLLVMHRCKGFSLCEVSYNYPLETVPAGMTPPQALRSLTMLGAAKRYPRGIPPKVMRLLDKELELIEDCRYEMFFLTVHDIVRFAVQEQILCQGRGSAANSAVCYCLGITAMDPAVTEPLLERFISRERKNEPPDIDVDFEHERREEVIQYVYKKYGRERAAIAAVVICYRTRSAIRDVGKALGIGEPLIDAFAKDHQWFDDDLAEGSLADMAQATGVQLHPHRARLWLELTRDLKGFPRHLSQHVGGFVLTQTKLTRLVPVENASMKDRSVIQWDKDDLEELGLMKVDVLALGMLTAIRRCLGFVTQRRGKPFTIYDIVSEDPATYRMIRKADTVGVFQIESRAQMSMLPRLRPEVFYDLVVEVAIVRPGPITGGMVHPYLQARERRRAGDPIQYEKPELAEALGRTLGIPIFQEQVMQISMVAAGFSAARADQLRRAMAAWKRKGGLHKFKDELLDGMRERGYSDDFAERIYQQMLGFGDYGFPESHAYSFALLAYKSSWLKCHEPEAFLAAMLNSQPMGFYAPSQLIQDAKRHGVRVLPPDVTFSDWDCSFERADEDSSPEQMGSDSICQDAESVAEASDGWESEPEVEDPPPRGSRPAIRLGLRMIHGINEAAARRIPEVRRSAPFTSTEDLSLRAVLDLKDLNALAAADALHSLSGHRRQQVWDASAQRRAPELLRDAPVNEQTLLLPPAREGEEIVFDYASMGLTLRRHPLALLRSRLARMRYSSAEELNHLQHGRHAAACGIVTVRQQPQTAKGTIFVTLEDETGPVNVIVWKHVREAQRDALLRARLLGVQGTWQCDADGGGKVRHLVAHRMHDLTPLLGRLGQQSNRSRDFH